MHRCYAFPCERKNLRMICNASLLWRQASLRALLPILDSICVQASGKYWDYILSSRKDLVDELV